MHPPAFEIESTRDAVLGAAERTWGWEIPTYLFLGGVTAGVMLTVTAVVLLSGRERVTRAMRWGLVAAPALLSLGMAALFVDLTLKLHVFRFYTTFQPTAPMSLGSWVLLLVYPLQLLLVLALPPEALERRIAAVSFVARAQRWAQAHLRKLAGAALVLALLLGVYTGVLLSATGAHALWSSGALGALFLASGASTGVAALMLAERDHAMRDRLARADIVLIGFELLTMVLWLAGLAAQGPAERAAAASVLVGPYAPVFLGVVVFGGLLVPAALEIASLRGKALHSRAVPALVLAGGLILRIVIVYAGQDGGGPVG